MGQLHLESVLHNVVQLMMKARNIEDYKVYIDGGTSNSDGFIGDVIFFHVIHGDKKEQLVLKTAKTNEKVRKIIDADTVYDREICMYTKVIPILEEFTRRKGISVIHSFIPKLLFNHKESLVMENLRMQNYLMWNKKKLMNMADIKLLFENYGIWHAITMAFKDQHPKEFSSCVDGWKDSRFSLNKASNLTKNFSREFSKVMKLLSDRGRSDLVNVYKNFEEHIGDYVYRRNLQEKDMIIISHGDTWCNNYLFKFKDNKERSEPSHVYFLDFQLSRPESPATEMSSILYNMGDTTCLQNSEELLSFYHQKLSETLKSLGSDPRELFTLDDLKRHWRQNAFFSVLHSFIYTRIVQCEADEAPDLGKMAENEEDFDGAFTFEMRDMETFWNRILEVFMHYGEILKENPDK